MKTRTVLSAATALSVAWCSAAWADEASERALAQQVAEMRRQIDELQRRMGDGSNRGSDELEQRIAELEKTTKKDSDGLFGYWKNGTKFDSADGAFKLAIIGRIQDDFTWFSSKDEVTDKLGPTVGGVEFRRARLGFQGTIYKNVFFKAEYDFAGGAVNYADVYMEIDEPYRQRGFGAYLVQELKRECYAMGAVPGCRCSPANTASRRTLQRAGFTPFAHILIGSFAR